MGRADNGNVMQIINNKDTTRNASYSYDYWNRLLTAQTANWSQSFNYDVFGNLFNVGATGTAPTFCADMQTQANNRFLDNCNGSNFVYDLSGNMTTNVGPGSVGSGGGTSYGYDAESQMTSVGGGSATSVNFGYDGDGNRVSKSTGKLYWYGVDGEVLEETDLAGAIKNEYLYFNGKRTARVNFGGNTAGMRCPPNAVCHPVSPSGSISYYFSDHLGSADVVTDASGNIQEESDYYPFGGERVVTDLGIGNNYKFTSKERDTETNLDYFGARFNASSMGRFMSPDPKPFSSKTLLNPQKWNKYAYVLNNPLALIDPDGREEVKVEIYASIPQQSFRFPPVIGPTWKGDGPAGHGPNATSYRVKATVTIETDQSARKSSNPVVSVTGDTTGSSVNWYGLKTQTGRSNVSGGWPT